MTTEVGITSEAQSTQCRVVLVRRDGRGTGLCAEYASELENAGFAHYVRDLYESAGA